MTFDVHPLDAQVWGEGSEVLHDLLLCTVGYETRARFLAQQIGRRSLQVRAYEYADNREGAFQENAQYFSKIGEVVAVEEHLYRKDVAAHVGAMFASVRRSDGGQVRPLKVAVDISSMDRDRLSLITQALVLDSDGRVTVDFYYSLAEFDEALVGSEGTVLVNRPLHGLEGWTDEPERPLSLILGAGFESRLALAALETLEPSYLHVMLPRGEDSRYDKVVRQRNAPLLNSGPIDEVEYLVTSPYRSHLALESLVHAEVQGNRVAIVPLGPKVFALASILVGLRYVNDVTVWRLSAGGGRQAEDRSATGSVVGLRVEVDSHRPAYFG